MTAGQFAGTQYWRDVVAKNWGRSWWSATAVTSQNAHRIIDMEDCVFINDNPGCAAVWPPSNLATLIADGYAAGPYSRQAGGTDNNTQNSGFLTQTGENTAPVMVSDGHQNGGIKLRSVWCFVRQPELLVNCGATRFLDFEDCGLFMTLSTNGIPVLQFGNIVYQTAVYGVNQIRVQGCNTAGILSAFQLEHPEVTGTIVSNGKIQYYPPPPFAGGQFRGGSGTTLGLLNDSVNILSGNGINLV